MPKIKEYTQLLNGCYRTEISVYPTSWNTKKVAAKKNWHEKEWYIWYRFHDPMYRNIYPTGKLVKERGMNKYKVLEQRQAYTEELCSIQQDLVDKKHYNPITDKFMYAPLPQKPKDKRPITPDTDLITAIDWAYENIKRAPGTLDNLKSTITYVWWAAENLGLESKRIADIEKADMRTILDEVGSIKNKLEKNKAIEKKRAPIEKWTASNFNHYLGDLGMLFTFLEDYDVYKVNPIAGIKKQTITRGKREILSDEEFIRVEAALKAYDYNYWRFVRIFEESNCRRPEILGVTYKDINLQRRTFSVHVKKGQHRWVDKEIESSVFPLWVEIVKEMKELSVGPKGMSVYAFTEGMQPSYREKPIRPEQITRRWKNHIKNALGVTADLYGLKHRKTTTDIDKMIDAAIKEAERKAAEKNSHSSTEMVRKVYDVRNAERKSELRRKLKRRLRGE